MQTGNIAARDKLTGRLWFQRTGDAFVDLGNVLLVKQNLDTGVVEQITWNKGRGQVTHEEPGQVKPKWSLKLDECTGEALRLLNLATAQDIHFAEPRTPWPRVISSVMLTGTRDVLELEADGTGGEGDYYFRVLDAEHNQLAEGSLSGSLSVDDELIVLTEVASSGVSGSLRFNTFGGFMALFTYDLLPGKRYTPIAESFVRGTVKIALQDQHNVSNISTAKAPKHELSFNAELRVTDRGDMTGGKFNEFELELLATSDVDILSRE